MALTRIETQMAQSSIVAPGNAKLLNFAKPVLKQTSSATAHSGGQNIPSLVVVPVPAVAGAPFHVKSFAVLAALKATATLLLDITVNEGLVFVHMPYVV